MRQRKSLQRRALDVAGEVMPGLGQMFVGVLVLQIASRIFGGL